MYDGIVRVEIDENGEQRISAPVSTHYVRHKKQYEGLRKKKERQHAFTFSDMEGIKEIIERVSEKNCGYLLYLQCFVDYDQMLKKGTHYLDKQDIMEILGIKKTALYEFIHEMVENGVFLCVIARGKKTFSVNPRFHFKGHTQNPYVVKSFSSAIRKIYGAVHPKDLGFVYKLLPFIHQETNTICFNPYEEDVSHIQYLSKGDIARITGLNEKTVYRKLRKLKFETQYVFAEIIRGNHRYFKVNPFVFYRKNGYPDATLRETFLIKNGFRLREKEGGGNKQGG